MLIEKCERDMVSYGLIFLNISIEFENQIHYIDVDIHIFLLTSFLSLFNETMLKKKAPYDINLSSTCI